MAIRLLTNHLPKTMNHIPIDLSANSSLESANVRSPQSTLHAGNVAGASSQSGDVAATSTVVVSPRISLSRLPVTPVSDPYRDDGQQCSRVHGSTSLFCWRLDPVGEEVGERLSSREEATDRYVGREVLRLWKTRLQTWRTLPSPQVAVSQLWHCRTLQEGL